MKGLQKWTVVYFPLLCFFLELLTVSSILLEHESICIQAHEISNSIHIFLLFVYPWMIPDFLFYTLSFVSNTISIRPFAEMCHLVASALCGLASLTLLCNITFCGNVSQTKFLLVGLGGALLSIIHFVEYKSIGKLLHSNNSRITVI